MIYVLKLKLFPSFNNSILRFYCSIYYRSAATETRSAQTDSVQRNEGTGEMLKVPLALQRLETCIDDVSSDTETIIALSDSGEKVEAEKDEESDEIRLYGPSKSIHKPLSGRNLPPGLISSPRQVVAEVAQEFDSQGGTLSLPEFSVELTIPPGALRDDGEPGFKQEIYLRVSLSIKLQFLQQICSTRPNTHINGTPNARIN